MSDSSSTSNLTREELKALNYISAFAAKMGRSAKKELPRMVELFEKFGQAVSCDPAFIRRAPESPSTLAIHIGLDDGWNEIEKAVDAYLEE